MKCNVTYVNEGGTVQFLLAFTDSNGVLFGVESLTEVRFQVVDSAGAVINGRSFENGLLTENFIVLTGDDLAISTSGPDLYLGIKAVYDSDIGAELTAVFEQKFIINDLKNIT